MRVLLTSLPIRSHLMPTVVPLAQAFRDRGHEAIIATGPRMAHVENTVVLPDVPAPEDFGTPPPWKPEVDGVLKVPLFAEELVARAAANILDFARRWRPDVILRETNEYGAQIAAEVLGLPHALLDIAPFAPLEIPDLDERKDEVRARFGVSGTDPVFTAALTPRSWHPAQHHYRVPTSRDRVETDIVATFGTNAGLLTTGSTLLHVVAEALGQVPARSVLAIGAGEWTGPRPGNVELRPEVPQQQLLNTARVFVTHAGYGSVRESLTAGVPMVGLPLFADQPRNAARVAELKAGVTVDVKGLTATALAEKIKHVLATTTYHDVAETMAREMAELPSFTDIPDHLVSAV